MPSKTRWPIWSRKSPAADTGRPERLLDGLREAGDLAVEDALLLTLQFAGIAFGDAQIVHELLPVGGLDGLAFPDEHQLSANLLGIVALQGGVHQTPGTSSGAWTGPQGLGASKLLGRRHTILSCSCHGTSLSAIGND